MCGGLIVFNQPHLSTKRYGDQIYALAAVAKVCRGVNVDAEHLRIRTLQRYPGVIDSGCAVGSHGNANNLPVVPISSAKNFTHLEPASRGFNRGQLDLAASWIEARKRGQVIVRPVRR